MSIEADFNLMKWVWTIILIPMAWLYNHLITTRKKIDYTQLELAKKLEREEMEKFVDRALKPIHEKLNDISSNVEHIRRHKDETRT